MPIIQGLVNEFADKLCKRKVEGSRDAARLTAELLRSVISLQKLPPTNQAAALIDAVRDIGEKLIAVNPVEAVVGNIIRRVLNSIREEELSQLSRDAENLKLSPREKKETANQDANKTTSRSFINKDILHPTLLHTLMENDPNIIPASETSPFAVDADEKLKSRKTLKHDVIETINLLIEDIDIYHEKVAEQAVEHIHQNEVILTVGRSRTVLEFLGAAKDKKRSFSVFVAEGAPRCKGHVLAKELADRGLQTTIIPDSAVFAMISRVNMVIVGVHSIMSNGGVIAPIGMNIVAVAAYKHAVPFVVVAGIHKLCPLYPHNPEALLNEMKSPSELLELGEFSDSMVFGCLNGAPLVQVANPAFDYVPPELVGLLITDIGGHTPSYMYRLIADFYNSEDLVLERKIAKGIPELKDHSS